MTRPDLRTPRPGELLRAATSKRATPPQSLSATPWAGNAAAAGLRALDREMIYLDEKAAQSVAEARAEIATVSGRLQDFQVLMGDAFIQLDGRLSTAEGAITDAETALTDLENVQLPALRDRLDDAEYDVKHISAEWITAGTIDTARLNVLDIAAETAQVIELDVSRLTASAATIDEGVVDKLWSDVVTTRFLTATEKIITEDVIALGAVTAQALNVVSTSGAGNSWRLNSDGLIAMHTSSQEALHIDSGGIRMWDAAGNLTVRLNGIQNYFQGELRTVPPQSGQRGVIVNNDGQGWPGVWLSPDGQGGSSAPAIVMREHSGYGPAMEIQRLPRLRLKGWRAGLARGSTTNQRGGERGPGQLSWTVNRDTPATLAQESLFAREAGFYTVSFYASLTVRPTSSRAFLSIKRNSGTEARVSMGQEDITTLTWMGWCAAGDRLDFTSFFDGTGTYGQTSVITILYHGE